MVRSIAAVSGDLRSTRMRRREQYDETQDDDDIFQGRGSDQQYQNSDSFPLDLVTWKSFGAFGASSFHEKDWVAGRWESESRGCRQRVEEGWLWRESEKYGTVIDWLYRMGRRSVYERRAERNIECKGWRCRKFQPALLIPTLPCFVFSIAFVTCEHTL